MEERPVCRIPAGSLCQAPVDLVVGPSAAGIGFIRSTRTAFSIRPCRIHGVDQRRISRIALQGMTHCGDRRPILTCSSENILKVLPGTANIAVVLGNSPNEQYWSEQIRAELKRSKNRISFTWSTNYHSDEMLQRATALPPNQPPFFCSAVGPMHRRPA